MDMHIHIRNILNDSSSIDDYILRLREYNCNNVCFLEHGERISKKHSGYLVDVLTAKKLKEIVKNANKTYKDIKILSGIEIDYSSDNDFRDRTIKYLSRNNFDVVIGSVHSLKVNDASEYFYAVWDLINNYPINVLGHLKLRENWNDYVALIEKIVILCKEHNVAIEINSSERSLWNEEQFFYMLSLIDKYNVSYTIGSDSHSLEDIGVNYDILQKRLANRGCK